MCQTHKYTVVDIQSSIIVSRSSKRLEMDRNNEAGSVCIHATYQLMKGRFSGCND